MWQDNDAMSYSDEVVDKRLMSIIIVYVYFLEKDQLYM